MVNFRVCNKCERELPLDSSNFKKTKCYTNEAFHKTCKDCEVNDKISKQVRADSLLCSSCKLFLPDSNFHNEALLNYRRNKQRICKNCNILRSRKAREVRGKEECIRSIILSRISSAKDRNRIRRKEKLEFTITIEDVISILHKQNGKCALSEIEMTYVIGKGRTCTNLSLDRIDPSKGYTKENIQLVCSIINTMKSDLSYSELLFFCKQIIKIDESKDTKITKSK